MMTKELRQRIETLEEELRGVIPENTAEEIAAVGRLVDQQSDAAFLRRMLGIVDGVR